MKQEKITCLLKILAKNAKLDALLAALAVCAEASLQEPGCEYYEIIQNIEYPHQLMLLQKYRDYAAYQAHFNTPAIKYFIDELQDALVDDIHYSLYVTRIDSAGVPSQSFSMPDLMAIMQD